MSNKILIFVPYYLPAFKAGGPVKSIANLVSSLKSINNNQIFIVTQDRDLGDDKSFNNIKVNEWCDVDGVNVFYSTKENISFSFLYKVISSIKPSYIYLNSFFDFNFSIKIIILNKLGLIRKSSIVLATRGELSSGALKFKKFKKYLYIKFSNLFFLYKNILFHVTSESEYDEVSFYQLTNGEIYLARNIPTLPDPFSLSSSLHIDNGIFKVIFLSRISPKKNLLFALSVLNNCKINIHFDIYGPIEDSTYWENCLIVISNLPSNIKVSYKGLIKPDNVSNTFSKYNMFLFPTFGENYGHVIVESLLVGTPVLISDNTPWSEIESYGLGYSCSLKMNDFLQSIYSIYNQSKNDTLSARLIRCDNAKKLIGYDKSVKSTRLIFNC